MKENIGVVYDGVVKRALIFLQVEKSKLSHRIQIVLRMHEHNRRVKAMQDEPIGR